MVSTTEYVKEREEVLVTANKSYSGPSKCICMETWPVIVSISNPFLPLRLAGPQFRGRRKISRSQTPAFNLDECSGYPEHLYNSVCKSGTFCYISVANRLCFLLADNDLLSFIHTSFCATNAIR